MNRGRQTAMDLQVLHDCGFRVGRCFAGRRDGAAALQGMCARGAPPRPSNEKGLSTFHTVDSRAARVATVRHRSMDEIAACHGIGHLAGHLMNAVNAGGSRAHGRFVDTRVSHNRRVPSQGAGSVLPENQCGLPGSLPRLRRGRSSREQPCHHLGHPGRHLGPSGASARKKAQPIKGLQLTPCARRFHGGSRATARAHSLPIGTKTDSTITGRRIRRRASGVEHPVAGFRRPAPRLAARRASMRRTANGLHRCTALSNAFKNNLAAPHHDSVDSEPA